MPWRDTDVQIEGPAVAEFQKLFLDTWQKQKGAKLSEGNYFPALKIGGTGPGEGCGQYPGRGQQDPFYCVCGRHLFCRAFASHDQLLFYS